MLVEAVLVVRRLPRTVLGSMESRSRTSLVQPFGLGYSENRLSLAQGDIRDYFFILCRLEEPKSCFAWPRMKVGRGSKPTRIGLARLVFMFVAFPALYMPR